MATDRGCSALSRLSRTVIPRGSSLLWTVRAPLSLYANALARRARR
jgi:hypothetical protein